MHLPLAMILRFVPYIGAVISAIFPLVLAAAVGPGWTMVFWTAALFLIVEPIVGHLVGPLLYGLAPAFHLSLSLPRPHSGLGSGDRLDWC
jgi:predicted PurR-regulated permease PerM